MASDKADRVQAHEVFAKHDPVKVRVNMPDGTPKDISIDDDAELEAHGLVKCGNCGAPNHVFQINEDEQPWIQCGCTGKRVQVQLGKKGQTHLVKMRDAMSAALDDRGGTMSRG